MPTYLPTYLQSPIPAGARPSDLPFAGSQSSTRSCPDNDWWMDSVGFVGLGLEAMARS